METVKWFTNEDLRPYSSATRMPPWAENDFIDQEGRISADDALKKNLIELVQTDYWNGMPLVRITNHSSWKIVVLNGREYIKEKSSQIAEITITLQHNASAVIPACFLSDTIFFSRKGLSIQEYLHYFTTAENQAGITLHMNDRLIGAHYGEFPLQVEIKYSRLEADA